MNRTHARIGALWFASLLWSSGTPLAHGADPSSGVEAGAPARAPESTTKPSAKEPSQRSTKDDGNAIEHGKQAVEPVLRPNEDATLRDRKTGDAGLAAPPETGEGKEKH